MPRRLYNYLRSQATALALAGIFLQALLLPLLALSLLQLETLARETQFVDQVRSQAHLLADFLDQAPESSRIARLSDDLVLNGRVSYVAYLRPNGESIASRFNPIDGTYREDTYFGDHGDHIFFTSAPSRGSDAGIWRIGMSEVPLEIELKRAQKMLLVLLGAYQILTSAMLFSYCRRGRHAAFGSHHVGRRKTHGSGEISMLAADLEHMHQSLQHRERALVHREARQQAVLDSAAEAIVTLDAEGRIETFNKAAEKLFGCPSQEVVGTPFAQFLAPEESERFYTTSGTPAACSGIELTGCRRSGEKCELMLSVSEAMIDGARCFTIFVQDISQRLAYESRLAHLATHDSLTDLPNRALFADRLIQVLARAGRGGHIVALLYVDLDRFKEINDKLGHHAGDRVLQAAAARLRSCLRQEDTLARLGGDEFTLLLPRLEHPASAAVVAENIIRALDSPLSAGDHEPSISCSIGIAIFPTDGKDADELSRNADAAMYAAKRAGGHGFRFYSAPPATETLGRIQLNTALPESDELGLR